MIHEFKEPIPVNTPLGKGYGILIETGWYDTYWTVLLLNGAFVTFPQSKVKAQRNYTLGLNMSDDDMKKVLE